MSSRRPPLLPALSAHPLAHQRVGRLYGGHGPRVAKRSGAYSLGGSPPKKLLPDGLARFDRQRAPGRFPMP